MATNKITNSLRNSIAAEKQKTDAPTTANNNVIKKTVTKPKVTKPATTKPVTAKSIAAKSTVTKPMASPSKTKAVKPVKPVKSVKKPATKKTSAKPRTAAPKLASKNTAQGSATSALIHNKVHQIVENHHNLCKTYIENLQMANDDLHEYLNQLAEIRNISSLVRLNLSYISSAPIRCQKMLAKNKSIFSEFFKFTLTKD